MAAPVGKGTMLDAAVDAVTVLALACDELGDRCGAIAFDDRIRAAMAPQHRSGRRVIESLLDFEARAVDSDFELAFQRVGRARRAFVVVFTDLIDEAAARSLLAGIPMLARRHAVAVASAWDSELLRLATRAPRTRLEAAELLVARDVLRTRAATAQRLRRAGAIVIEAPAGQLPSSCLDAYLAAKSRARL
jgi:uncharacterized protein (DUF58 family)